MSKAADELERMAEELKRLSKEAAEQMDARKDLMDKLASATVMATYADSASRLRQRAAELRQQGSISVYALKPAGVRAGQWWSADADEPRRVVGIYRYGQTVYARCGAIDGIPIDHPVSEMMNSAAFRYHGDADQPAQNE